MKIVVVIGEVTNSSRLEKGERSQLQRVLHANIEKINDKFEGQILAPVMISGGNEFRGGFQEEATAFRALEDIIRAFLPERRIRGGIGIGEVKTEFSETVTEMDGPAFRRAEKGMKGLNASAGFRVITGDQVFDELLEPLLELYWSVISNWTKTQRRYSRVKYLEPGISREELANRLGVSQASVSKVLRKASTDAINSVREYVLKLLRYGPLQRDMFKSRLENPPKDKNRRNGGDNDKLGTANDGGGEGQDDH